MDERGEVPIELLDAVRASCLHLPEAVEESAWVGTRWQVAGRTFAHVLMVVDGWPPAYATAVGVDGALAVLVLRSAGTELDVLRSIGPPFFAPPWRADEVGVVVDERTDRDEIRELVTESYCTRAPARLVRLVERPDPGDRSGGPRGQGG